MKKRIFAVILLIILMFTPMIANAENLLINADFKDNNGEEITNWVKGDANKDFFRIGVVDDGVLCIDNNITNFSRVTQLVKGVKPNSYYKISGKIKVEKAFNSGAYFLINILDFARTEKSQIITSEKSDWQEVEMYGITEEGQRSFSLNLCLGERENRTLGKAFFKDIKVEEVKEIPKGVNAALLYMPELDLNIEGIAINLVSKLVFVGVFFATGWCIYKNIEIKEQIEKIKRKISKKDIIIMAVLTLAYMCLALYNLGDRTFPKTGWLGEKTGEYVIIELPKMTQIEKITYCQGLNDKRGATGVTKLEYLNGNYVSDDEVQRYHLLFVYSYDSYAWQELKEDAKTSLIKLETFEPGMDLKEIAIYEKGSTTPLKGLKIIEDTTQKKVGKYLIDEQDIAQYKNNYKNSTYFDECLYARTGYEYFNNLEGFESTHPPLGKILFGIGIKMFGMTPFGWRIMGTLFGAAMIFLMYIFALKLFKERIYATMAALLIMFDCMHFVQTRTCLIDSYSLVFIILMYYYMADIYTSTDNKVTAKYIKSLVLSGLFWSLGIATKWLVVYGGVGLAALYFISVYKNLRKDKKEVIKSMALATLMFVIVPIIVYLFVYIPVLRPTKEGYSLLGVFNEVKKMFLFHKNEDIQHIYRSAWYEWFLMLVPMKFYFRFANDTINSIVTVGNPLIWWTSVLAVVMAIYLAYKKKDNYVWVFIIGYISQYFPWMFIKRTLFIYHYFSAIPFAIFAIIYVLKNLDWNKKKNITIYMILTILSFIIFYPHLSGMSVPEWYNIVIKCDCVVGALWVAYLLNTVLKMVL